MTQVAYWLYFWPQRSHMTQAAYWLYFWPQSYGLDFGMYTHPLSSPLTPSDTWTKFKGGYIYILDLEWQKKLHIRMFNTCSILDTWEWLQRKETAFNHERGEKRRWYIHRTALLWLNFHGGFRWAGREKRDIFSSIPSPHLALSFQYLYNHSLHIGVFTEMISGHGLYDSLVGPISFLAENIDK